MRLYLSLGLALLLPGCEKKEVAVTPAEIEIVGSDYAFIAPSALPEGRTTFRFRNNGKARHELNIARLKSGVSIDKYLSTIRANETVQPLIEGPVGVLFAAPGDVSDGKLTVNLTAGERYAVICIFSDSAGAKRHYDLGMFTTLAVERATARRTEANPVTDTIIATDYAFQYPRTVAPGRHTFLMRNEGKQRHELSIGLLKTGITLERLRQLEKTGVSVDSLFEGEFGLLHSRGGQAPLGHLTIDMLPGREYVIVCFFQDSDKAPAHYELGMFGSIRVATNTTN